MSDGVSVRPATVADVAQIHTFIVELADYERAREQVVGTPEMLADALFGERPCAEAWLAELDGRAAGFALVHGSFSTWECRPGLWLEDLYVPPAPGARAWAGCCSRTSPRSRWRGAAPGWSGTRWTGTSRR